MLLDVESLSETTNHEGLGEAWDADQFRTDVSFRSENQNHAGLGEASNGTPPGLITLFAGRGLFKKKDKPRGWGQSLDA